MPKQSNLGALSTLERAERGGAVHTKVIVPAESESECRGGSGKEKLPLGWTENWGKINKIYNSSAGKINTEHNILSISFYDAITGRNTASQQRFYLKGEKKEKNQPAFRWREPQAVTALISPHWAAPLPSAEPDRHIPHADHSVPCSL